MSEAQDVKHSNTCKNYMKVAFSQTGHREAIVTRLRCKLWSCEPCAKLNAWIWRNWLLKRLPEVSDQWWLLTLTASRFYRERYSSLVNIREHLDAFFKRVRRVFGEIEYVRVYEKHATSKAIHCHIIITGITPYVAIGYSSKHVEMAIGVLSRKCRNGVWAVRTWVKNTAQAIKMGFIADIQPITGEAQKAVWYVTKYLTKAQQDLSVKGLRHVQVTKGIGSPPKQGNDLKWDTAYYITARMFEAGTRIEDINTGDVIDNNYWEKHSFYPID